MLKKVFQFAVVFIFSVSSMPAFGQAFPGRMRVEGFVGAGGPARNGPFMDYFQSDVGFGGGLEFRLLSNTTISVQTGHQEFESDKSRILREMNTTRAPKIKIWDGNGSVLRFSAGINQYVQVYPPRFSVSFSAGGALYILHYEDFTVRNANMSTYQLLPLRKNESKGGLFGGLGFHFRATHRVWLFTDFSYHHVFTELSSDYYSGVIGIKIRVL